MCTRHLYVYIMSNPTLKSVSQPQDTILCRVCPFQIHRNPSVTTLIASFLESTLHFCLMLQLQRGLSVPLCLPETCHSRIIIFCVKMQICPFIDTQNTSLVIWINLNSTLIPIDSSNGNICTSKVQTGMKMPDPQRTTPHQPSFLQLAALLMLASSSLFGRLT